MIRAFEDRDRAAMLAFADALPEHDLMFLGRDLRHPKVVEAWGQAIVDGTIASVLFEEGGRVLGTGALVTDPLGWSRHVGEVRVLVASDARGRGVGRAILEALIAEAQARGLAKLSARMTPDQTAAIELFESQGFQGEALLKDQLCDRAGQLHDLVVLSVDLQRRAARDAAYLS